MLMLHFADGSILQDRTLHAEARNCGRFILQSGTLHAEARNRGRFHSPDPNPPRFRPESRTVRCKQNQPSTRRLDITDGPCLRSAPSMLMPHIADGSILQSRTLHENAPHHGRFSIQSGTIRAEARNRGRFHSPDQFPRPIPQTHSPGSSPRPEPLRCLIQSRQFNMPVGMELTTSSARQDTAPLSTILPDKKPAIPATFVTSAPVGAMDNPALSRALSGTAQGNADEHTVGILLGPGHCR